MHTWNLRGKQQGFGILEVLVAVVVLSIGIIGAVSLSTTAIRQSSNANQQIMATTLAQQLIERMRANQAGVDDGDYNVGDVAIDCADAGAVPKLCEFSSADGGTAASRCTTDEMADFDVYAIACGEDYQALPSPTLNLSCLAAPCDPGSMHRLTVTWLIPPGNAEDRRSLVMTFFPGSSQ